MPSGYSSREDPGQMKKNKQSMADLKLRRLTELNSRLREDLERERIPVSQASKRCGTSSSLALLSFDLYYSPFTFYFLHWTLLRLCDLMLCRTSKDLRLTYSSIISYTNSTKDFMVPSIWGGIPKGEDPYVVQTSGGKFILCPYNATRVVLIGNRLLHCDVKTERTSQERYDIREHKEGVNRRIRISLCDNTSHKRAYQLLGRCSAFRRLVEMLVMAAGATFQCVYLRILAGRFRLEPSKN